VIKITSRDNQKLKFARRVREGQESDFIFVEGARLTEEMLRSKLRISDVFVTEKFIRTERGQSFLKFNESNKLAELPEKLFASLSDTKSSQGIIVICEKPPSGKDFIERNLEKNRKLPLVVLLHQINNPSNLGAILRTFEAVDAVGVITTKNSADAFSAKALRGSMGAALRIALWQDAEFSEILAWSRAKRLTSVCADVNAQKSYLEVDWKKPRLLIFGSEAHGLSMEERSAIDESLIIPMENAVESLNLAVSSAVILFEAKRQSES
jgi:TrmH family RNA methyltransferase